MITQIIPLSLVHTVNTTLPWCCLRRNNKPAAKPPISSARLKPSQLPDLMLPCQIVPSVMKPVIRPSLPADLTLIENCNLVSIKPEQDAINASQIEFLLTLIRSGMPYAATVPGELPTWGGIHALVSKVNVPLMRVGFLPMIPKPVTEYTTVHKALTNYQSVRRQLNQPILPIFSDEGVFRIVTDVGVSYPDICKDIYPMVGMFHYCKVLLRCSGGYVSLL